MQASRALVFSIAYNNIFSISTKCFSTAISRAVCPSLLQIFISHLFFNQCQPRTNESPLIVACDRNKEAVVKHLLSFEACDVTIIDCFNRNALHYACRNGQVFGCIQPASTCIVVTLTRFSTSCM
jgi:ankyrin repeat protein